MKDSPLRTSDIKEAILNSMPESVIYLDRDNKIIWANRPAYESIGTPPERLVGSLCHEILAGSADACVGCPAAEALATGRLHEGEITTPDGRIWSVTAHPVRGDGAGIEGIVEVRKDVTAQRIADASLRETKELFRLLAENASDLVYRLRLLPTRGFDYVSRASTEITGYTPDELYLNADLFFNSIDPKDRQRVKADLEKGHSGGRTTQFSLTKKNGGTVWLEQRVAPILNEGNTVIAVGGIARDITERKDAEDRQRLIVQILEVLNQVSRKKDRIMLILLLIKEYVGFDAVGIRLREGDDFPYYETRGFEVSFVESEKSICARTKTGEIVTDSRGNPALECLCGTVISGAIDHSLPFYTRNGSFWTNSKPDLDALSRKGIVRGLRGRCFTDGYESVALIPLRSESGIIGLLQLNDRRKEMVTPEMVSFLEGVGATIGIAFERNRIEEEREGLIARLEDSLAKVKALSGLLPICAKCKKIRDDKGYWSKMEKYIGEHADVSFTHGICPDCEKELSPGRAKEGREAQVKASGAKP